jgi:hypothetical protein
LWPSESQQPAHEGHGLPPELLLELLFDPSFESPPSGSPLPPLEEPEDPDALPPELLDVVPTSAGNDESGPGKAALVSMVSPWPAASIESGLDVSP